MNWRIKKLEEQFSTHLLHLTISREATDNNYLPPWLFDYSESFYTDQVQAINQFQQSISNLQPHDLPNLKDLQNVINPLPAYLASHTDIPTEWMQELEPCFQDFIKRVMSSKERISLPFLYLNIQTLLAYCGGVKYREGKSYMERGSYIGKCGFPTLVIGRETLCRKCHKLICPACGYCSGNEEEGFCDDYKTDYEDRVRNRGSAVLNRPTRLTRRTSFNLCDDLDF